MRRLIGHGPTRLGSNRAPWLVILLALVLTSPSLFSGLALDDYLQLVRLDPSVGMPGFAHAPTKLFSLGSGDFAERRVLMESGYLPWWTAPDFRASFWRPLSALTHVVDYRVRPRSALLGHVHSMLWFAALLIVLRALYRRFHAPWVAHLALLLYAVDDARGMVVGWIANRNALVAATLAFAALLAHDRARRDAWRLGAWLAPALFGASLLGGEAALAVAAYLLAHALFIDRGSLPHRLARLWPYATLSAVWLAAYRVMGHGAQGGGLYVDPAEGLPYLRALIERLPVLLAAQLGVVPSDVWPGLPRPAQRVFLALSLATLGVLAMAFAPVLRRRPVCRFWLLGAVLSLAPVCATLPGDRLLVFAGVGAMAAVALLMAETLEPAAPAAGFALRAARRVAVPLLLVAHLLVAPLLLPLRALTLTLSSRFVDRVDASIPRSDDVADKTLVIVNAPLDFLVLWYVPAQRAVGHVPRPRAVRLLVGGTAELEVTRLDAMALRLRPAQGFLESESQRAVRGASRPFHPGDEVALSDLRVRVGEVSADGRPLEADFSFTVPLEDPSLLWMRWEGSALVPFSPPAPGRRLMLPRIRAAEVLGGRQKQ